MSIPKKIVYPPLPAEDGIRLLFLLPGVFDEPLKGRLVSVPFSSRPAYVALSYTWSDRDNAHAAIPIGRSPSLFFGWGTAQAAFLSIGHNLALALKHLRPSTGLPLPLWIDQVCINQDDIAERGAQVALMSFIYHRSRLVVSWLGVALSGTLYAGQDHYAIEAVRARHAKVRPWGLGLVLPEGDDDAAVRQRHLGERVLEDSSFFEPIPLREDVALDPDNPYWQRLWIVQEVCLAPRVAFMLGPHLWSEHQFTAAVRRLARKSDQDRAAAKSVEQLLDARTRRFGQDMRFETLVERFSGCGCGELRDKVYALVGLSIDVESTASRTTAVAARDPASNDDWRGRARGAGEIKIDYSRLFFDVWRDAVGFMLWRASPLLDFGKNPEELEDERRAKVVRFAGLLQRAFAGKVEEELQHAFAGKIEEELRKQLLVAGCPVQGRRSILAKGYIAGTILHLGPTYDDFVGSYTKYSEWRRSWVTHYDDPIELENLRKMEEQFSIKIINHYGEADIARVKSFAGNECFAYSPLRQTGLGGAEADAKTFLETTRWIIDTGVIEARGGGPPRRFLGSKLCMGLVPPAARAGDKIIRFWNCDAAIVVRAMPGTETITVAKMTTSSVAINGDESNSNVDGAQKDLTGTHRDQQTIETCPPVYEIIGRADVADLQSSMTGDPKSKDAMKVYGARFEDGKYIPLDKPARVRTDAVYVNMDFEMLQILSASIMIRE